MAYASASGKSAPAWTRKAALVGALAVTVTTTVILPAGPAAADGEQCTFGPKNPKYAGRPWSLQRVLLDDLWSETKGKGVKVAVIDTGVDVKNPQLRGAVDTSLGKNEMLPNLKDADGNKIARGKEDGTTDTVGHGTRVAGIIAARPAKGTGFVGLAPKATIIPIQQNDADGHGTAETLAKSIRYAMSVGAQVINISQDTANAVRPAQALQDAVNAALDAKIVVVASAGNDGLDGKVQTTYPASFPGVLAVAASDRNNERAAFSQSGDFVGVAAPGVDMVSTVPGGGHCSDNGTSFSAPYVAGVAALVKAKHPDWTAAEVVAQIEQTAERSIAGHDRLVGWGVVDPLRAVTEDPDHPIETPSAHEGVTRAKAPEVAKLHFGETADQRDTRLATYTVVGAAVLVAGLGGASVAVRDARRRSRKAAGGA
ncbi:type VII secretion-associated serine protease mycosin [Streptomyces antnestii]|uniref:Type VII secretion-associated serine protease mycosin n=1 Tax=Streptomyces antnestii TaxID=2494256 RepID=A0A3S2W0T2_9ACTN|nr:type VII secretion-associated serine protease mycosin [Streptomyces sp. San01]RVU22496.1 type VII secretion-associated serine protease mycosin [Streptomyces sp. San01]